MRVCEPRRALGRTGFTASPLGIGDLADRQVPMEDCIATARRALDAGLNVIDTAPGYEDGYSERLVGEAVRRHGRRDEVFLISKIDYYDRPIDTQVRGSLDRLGLDHIDLMVFHGLSSMDLWHDVTRPGGLMHGLERELKQGTIRFRGISSHHPEVLRAAILSGLCDVVMFAVGPYADPRYTDEILPLAQAHGLGVVGFKVFGAGKLLGDTEGYQRPLSSRPRGKVSSGGVSGVEGSAAAPGGLPHLSVEECLRYTLTLDPDVALLGLSFPNEQDAAFEAYRAFIEKGPLTAAEMAEVRGRAAEAIRGKGKVWWNPPETD